MGLIMKNGISYGGGSIDITQAEYDELKASGQVNPSVTYYITDGVYEDESNSGNANNASAISCVDVDGNQSTVQNEIDKNRDDINELNLNLEWKLAGSTNTGEVLLPSDFTELNILHSSSKSNYVIHMCRELVSDVGYNISNGYYVSADNSDVTTIFVSQTKVKGMYNVSQIVVYYR